MWVCKFKVFNKESIGVEIVKEAGVTIYYYPINNYLKGNRYYFTTVSIVSGSEKNIKKFFRKFRKLKKVSSKRRSLIHLEIKKNFFIAVTSETKNRNLKLLVDLFYNEGVIHIKPSVIYPDGWEEQEIACFNRKILERIMGASRKLYSLKLSYLRQEKIENLAMLTILPRLTEKQKQALELAQKHGYYEYPRKTEVQKLAKFTGLSFSTFQAHLRKAEKKILPFFIKNL